MTIAPIPAGQPFRSPDPTKGVPPAAAAGGLTPAQIVATWRTDWAEHVPAGDRSDPARAAAAIADIQKLFAPANGGVKRAQHAKALYTTTRAELRVPADLPAAVAHGPFAPGAKLRAIVRVSNVAGVGTSDEEADLRGIAIRLTDDQGHVQDLLMNTSETFMAKGAKGAIVGAQVRGKGLGFLAKAVWRREIGFFAAIELVMAGKRVMSRGVSLAGHTFWSRTPFQLGEHAVKLRLVPVESDPKLQANGPEQLSRDLERRLDGGVVRYKLQVQGFRDPTSTPLDDMRKAWDSPWLTVGELTLPWAKGAARQEELAHEREVDGLAFGIGNRWGPEDGALKGIGELNAIREAAYQASADGRGVKDGKRCPFGFG